MSCFVQTPPNECLQGGFKTFVTLTLIDILDQFNFGGFPSPTEKQAHRTHGVDPRISMKVNSEGIPRQ